MELITKLIEITFLNPATKDWISSNIEEFSFKKNEIILREGKTCQYLYFVKTGMLGGYSFIDDKEICNWIAIENSFASSYYSFLARKPSFEIIEAFEDTTVQAISYKKLNELYRKFPESERAGRLILEDYYLKLEETLLLIKFKTVKDRYNIYHSKQKEIVKRAPLGRIASYLGMTQESLSRIRAEK